MRFHQIWLGSEVPKHLMTFAESWKRHHPEDEHWLWRDEDIEKLDLVNWPLWRVAHKRVPADVVYQFKADLARYEILYRYGGVYADMDTTCQRSTHELFDTDKAVLGWEAQNRWIGNTVIYAPKYHPGMKAIIETIPQVAHSYYPRVTRPNKLTGPKMITPILRSRDDVTILDEHIFYPVPYSEPERSTEDHPDSYVVHHWQHQRDMRGIQW